MPNKEYAFWLVPAAPLQAQLTKIIQRLAKEYDAALFEPHVTIYIGQSNDAEVRAAAQRVTSEFKCCELVAEKLDHTELLAKTLFVQFRQSAEVQKMTEMIKSACMQPSTYALNPHLSLLYKHMQEANQTMLCQTLKVPKGPYMFDRIQVLDMEAPFRGDQQSINRWRIVFDQKLGA